jgi:hypothetical protein
MDQQACIPNPKWTTSPQSLTYRWRIWHRCQVKFRGFRIELGEIEAETRLQHVATRNWRKETEPAHGQSMSIPMDLSSGKLT